MWTTSDVKVFKQYYETTDNILDFFNFRQGGMAIYVDGHCFSGDTLFRRSIGRSDFYGGDYRTLLNSIKDVLYSLPDDTVLLPGHMEPTTVAEEKRGNPFV